jgi:NTP pyrophosphatase (non-canonical NTP hydrolase)
MVGKSPFRPFDHKEHVVSVSLETLRNELRTFVHEREWEVFQTPKNLAMAMIVEAAELVEHFQWLTPEQSARLGSASREKAALEMADILIYLTRLADVLEIDLLDAVQRKMQINATKYPVEKAKGKAAKYHEL